MDVLNSLIFYNLSNKLNDTHDVSDVALADIGDRHLPGIPIRGLFLRGCFFQSIENVTFFWI